MNRRTWLQTALAAASTTALPNAWAQALATSSPLLTRAIPSSGQRLPIIGLGSSATFAQVASSEDREALKNVMAKMVELGGTVFDTAPSYGASEARSRRTWVLLQNYFGRPNSTSRLVAVAQPMRTPHARNSKRLSNVLANPSSILSKSTIWETFRRNFLFCAKPRKKAEFAISG